MRTATHDLPFVSIPFTSNFFDCYTNQNNQKARLQRFSKRSWRRARHAEGPAGARLNLAWGIPPARGHGWSHSTLDLKVGLLKVPLLPRGTVITIPAVLEMKAKLGQRPFPCLWPLLRKITQMIEISVTSFSLHLSSPTKPQWKFKRTCWAVWLLELKLSYTRYIEAIDYIWPITQLKKLFNDK